MACQTVSHLPDLKEASKVHQKTKVKNKPLLRICDDWRKWKLVQKLEMRTNQWP